MKTVVIDYGRMEEDMKHRLPGSNEASKKFQQYIMDAIKDFIDEYIVKEDEDK